VGVVEAESAGLRDEGVERVMQEALGGVERLDASLTPIELPAYPCNSVLEVARGAEAAVFFEDLITDDHLATLCDDAARAWKNTLPVARVIPAVQHLKARQVRALMQADALSSRFLPIRRPFDTVSPLLPTLFGQIRRPTREPSHTAWMMRWASRQSPIE